MNVLDPIDNHAATNGGRTAIVFGDERVSYTTFADKVHSLAAGFEKLGLKKGDRVALWMPNCPEMLYAFYAALSLGVIEVSLNTMFKKDEVDFILGNCAPGVLIVHERYLQIATTLERVRNRQLQLVSLGSPAAAPEQTLAYDSLLKCGKAPSASLAPDDEAVIGYTSGTTGFPKGAVHSHGNILWHLAGMSKVLAIPNDDVVLAALPLFQLTAFLVHPGLVFFNGGTLVLMEKFDTEPFLDLITREKVTRFAAVPTIYQMLYQAAKARPADRSSVRFAMCGGSPLSPHTRAQFEREMGFRIIHSYGSTETPMMVASESPDVPSKGVSVGKTVPHLRLRLVNRDGALAALNEEGEIQMGADHSVKYYWNNPAATANAIQDGWFKTGDIGKWDADGHLHVVDRATDMIIRGGFNVYPAEVERVLLEDPRIREAVVIAEPHERLGEVPKAFIVPAEGSKLTEADVIALSRERLANYKAVEVIEFVSPEFFPRNALGKVVKHKLRSPRA